ncbi:hypothetical protein BKA70DRAFT_1236429 [Coprinopsis sp. MPI-PUGE-AT-0042]|nr:hypothetical protein BKA70DRAFT_1236429 [Coprinopsis sp. MPI-PUGE-AT-0042]
MYQWARGWSSESLPAPFKSLFPFSTELLATNGTVIDPQDQQVEVPLNTSSVASGSPSQSFPNPEVKVEEDTICPEPLATPRITRRTSQADQEGSSHRGGSRGSVSLQPLTVAEPEFYRRQTLSLAGHLAHYITEGDEAAYQIGCLVIQASQRAVDMAINRVLDHAFSRGIIVDYPCIDDEASSRPTPSQRHHFGLPHDRSQTEQLGFAFSTNPAVLSPLVASLWEP